MREFRGAWVTPLAAGTMPDWPSTSGLDADAQKAELRALLDRARDIGLNAIVLHVRTAGDALYPSKLVPWSAFLSGRSGIAPKPAYDPLAFAIEEAHARGLQLHAWFNPFRAMLPNFRGAAAVSHVTRAHPSWVRRYGTQTWIDPGEPAARKAVLDAILEVVEKYDVDGIHLDDYFYPYREQRTVTRRVNKKRVRVREDIPFPDASTWKKYGAKTFRDRDDWRRANIDGFVRDLYDGVKKKKPWVPVGISPFGIWRSGTPSGVTGLDAINEIYADSRKWLREGWVDYIVPQLYWPLDGAQRRFTSLDRWWRSENPMDRHIWPGLFTAQVTAARPPWSPSEIPAQIDYIRAARGGSEDQPGHVHFRFGTIPAVPALQSTLRDSTYALPAVSPAYPWLASRGSSAPPPPAMRIDGTSLYYSPSGTEPILWWIVQIRDTGGQWHTTVRYATDTRIELTSLSGSRLAVTAIDRVGRSSAPAIVEVH